MLILISGQADSGKSLYAETRLSEFRSSPKIYVAMSKIVDEEMRERVKKHQAMRSGKGFITVEKTQNLGRLEIPTGSAIMIESLTAWTANEMFTETGVKESGHVVTKILSDLSRLLEHAENIVIVSDDIFSDGVEYDALTEEYVKTLALLTVKIAEIADEVVEFVLGFALRLKDC
ncbi:MAG: bifunctional adenosylcobinamide kinase/adenosylcobinamide-phosphate guanylyltransferase [Synergistaceae bacterium]|nr:bifunctional adenosylcobinamide kinase/adenosylcobinamide-phosphate guanylyltransferase [Synergistaceae bacterium]